MSTRIYHGYRLAAGVDLFEFTQRLRPVMDPVRDRLDAALLAEDATSLVDRADLAGGPRPASPLRAAYKDYRREQRKADARHRGHDPHRFEISLAADQGRVFVILHTEQQEFVEAFEALPEVDEYGYWNSADRPKGVSKAAWAERERIWSRILPGAGVPADTMVSMRLRGATDVRMSEIVRRCLADPHSPERALVADALPDQPTRARDQAWHAVIVAAATRGWDPLRAVMLPSRGIAPVGEAAAACLDTTIPLIEQVTAREEVHRTVDPAELAALAAAADRFIDAQEGQ